MSTREPFSGYSLTMYETSSISVIPKNLRTFGCDMDVFRLIAVILIDLPLKLMSCGILLKQTLLSLQIPIFITCLEYEGMSGNIACQEINMNFFVMGHKIASFDQRRMHFGRK